MSEVAWPPADKVKYLGFLSVPDVAWVALAVTIGVLAMLSGQLIAGAVLAVAVSLWGRAQIGGTRIRTRARLRVQWLARGEKQWSAPLRGKAGVPRMLRGVVLETVSDSARTVGVVRSTKRSWFGGTSSYTVMLPVTCDSVTFLGDAEQDRRFSLWGDLLGAQCVENGSSLAAERIAWTDIHRAANPFALRSEHARLGVPGPATADYLEHLAGFGSVAADHQVVVSVTVSNAQLAIARTDGGFTGTTEDVLRQAALSVGRRVRAKLEANDFHCGEFLRPVDIARLIVEAGDPFVTRSDVLSAKERFGLPERMGPDSVDVARTHVAIDNAYHRCFQLVWPRTKVQTQWLWRVLAVDGPKLTTTVFETVPPSLADIQREARAARQRSNSHIVAARKGGDETSIDGRKRAALRADEMAVADGHEELDCYSVIVMSARTVVDLNRRCERLREALRESGKANVRELTGCHDEGVRVALPLGVMVGGSKE